jgi:hypothetical protein
MILENLLKVSKPYEYQPGDVVKNINPTCAHYRSKGVLVYVHSNGDLTYKVLNSSPTYQPGDQLTKSQDQMMKVLGPRLRLPAFESKLNELRVELKYLQSNKLNIEDNISTIKFNIHKQLSMIEQFKSDKDKVMDLSKKQYIYKLYSFPTINHFTSRIIIVY